MAVLGLRFCARTFSSCRERGPLFIAVCGPLTVAASLVAEHRLQTRRLSSCGSRAQSLRGMWALPRPGLEPVSPALAGRFSTAAPPGKPDSVSFNMSLHFNVIFFIVHILLHFSHHSGIITVAISCTSFFKNHRLFVRILSSLLSSFGVFLFPFQQTSSCFTNFVKLLACFTEKPYQLTAYGLMLRTELSTLLSSGLTVFVIINYRNINSLPSKANRQTKNHSLSHLLPPDVVNSSLDK